MIFFIKIVLARAISDVAAFLSNSLQYIFSKNNNILQMSELIFFSSRRFYSAFIRPGENLYSAAAKQLKVS